MVTVAAAAATTAPTAAIVGIAAAGVAAVARAALPAELAAGRAERGAASQLGAKRSYSRRARLGWAGAAKLQASRYDGPTSAPMQADAGADVPVSAVVHATVQESRSALDRLASQLGSVATDRARRDALGSYVSGARSLLTRALLAVRWAASLEAGAVDLERVRAAIGRQQDELRSAADNLFFVHDAMPLACAPRYDVDAAADLLCSGRFTSLPTSIDVGAESACGQPKPSDTDASLRWLIGALRARRAGWDLPRSVELAERAGALRAGVAGEYVVFITSDHDEATPWRLLRLRLLAGRASDDDDADAPAGAWHDHGVAPPSQHRALVARCQQAIPPPPRPPDLRPSSPDAPRRSSTACLPSRSPPWTTSSAPSAPRSHSPTCTPKPSPSSAAPPRAPSAPREKCAPIDLSDKCATSAWR